MARHSMATRWRCRGRCRPAAPSATLWRWPAPTAAPFPSSPPADEGQGGRSAASWRWGWACGPASALEEVAFRRRARRTASPAAHPPPRALCCMPMPPPAARVHRCASVGPPPTLWTYWPAACVALPPQASLAAQDGSHRSPSPLQPPPPPPPLQTWRCQMPRLPLHCPQWRSPPHPPWLRQRSWRCSRRRSRRRRHRWRPCPLGPRHRHPPPPVPCLTRPRPPRLPQRPLLLPRRRQRMMHWPLCWLSLCRRFRLLLQLQQRLPPTRRRSRGLQRQRPCLLSSRRWWHLARSGGPRPAGRAA
mmetsp:Transcript_12926/g.39136  ORF Transcript_12926/g.39136 Transcript_12926/m.39136 type:complete len:303 (+) Transcript_12926:2052-2960(+)